MDHTVLIIEDEKLIIVSTQMVLEAAGFRVESAMNGEEGIGKAKTLKPDLILLDIMMPGIDGWETLTRLKRDPETSGVPVIIFTAMPAARHSAIAATASSRGGSMKPTMPRNDTPEPRSPCVNRP